LTTEPLLIRATNKDVGKQENIKRKEGVLPWMGRGGVGSNPKATGHTLFKGKMIILKKFLPVKSFFKKV